MSTSDLEQRIFRIVTAKRNMRGLAEMPGAILEEIERTHVLVERDRWERIIGAAEAAVNEWGAESRVGLLETDLEPIRPHAAESDTPETS